MEEEFKQELADIWGVDDEDDLPDSLQVMPEEVVTPISDGSVKVFHADGETG